MGLGVARADSNLSPNTREQYAAAFRRYVAGSRVAALTLREANRVPVLELYLQGIADVHGTGAAKTARSVMSNIIGMAVRFRVLDHNAMRDVRPAKSSTRTEVAARDTRRAFTRAERDRVMLTADHSDYATRADAADIVAFMAGTGVRISEALGQRWEDVDLPSGRICVRGTKTAASTRWLTAPPWLAERLRTRAAQAGT